MLKKAENLKLMEDYRMHFDDDLEIRPILILVMVELIIANSHLMIYIFLVLSFWMVSLRTYNIFRLMVSDQMKALEKFN